MANRRGLTFVELFIAVLMVAILFIGLATHLRGGITVWERVTQSTDLRQRERASLERLQRDLSSAFVLDGEPAHYGASDVLLSPATFSNASLAFYAVPARDANAFTPVQYLSYWCGALGDRSGLWRQRWTADQSRSKQGPDPELILPGCDRLRFAYAYLRSNDPAQQAQPLDWQPIWLDSPDALPRLIRMEMDLTEAVRIRGAERISTRKIKRHFLVPAGVLRAQAGSQP